MMKSTSSHHSNVSEHAHEFHTRAINSLCYGLYGGLLVAVILIIIEVI